MGSDDLAFWFPIQGLFDVSMPCASTGMTVVVLGVKLRLRVSALLRR